MNDDLTGPFILWEDYGYEGWRPRGFQTIEEAVNATGHGEPRIITKRVNFKIVEENSE